MPKPPFQVKGNRSDRVGRRLAIAIVLIADSSLRNASPLRREGPRWPFSPMLSGGRVWLAASPRIFLECVLRRCIILSTQRRALFGAGALGPTDAGSSS